MLGRGNIVRETDRPHQKLGKEQPPRVPKRRKCASIWRGARWLASHLGLASDGPISKTITTINTCWLKKHVNKYLIITYAQRASRAPEPLSGLASPDGWAHLSGEAEVDDVHLVVVALGAPQSKVGRLDVAVNVARLVHLPTSLHPPPPPGWKPRSTLQNKRKTEALEVWLGQLGFASGMGAAPPQLDSGT